MKKLIAGSLIAVMVLGAAVPTQAEMAKGEGRGGFMGFIAGCCFGIRAAGEYNEGKDIHWREWCRYIPYVGIIFPIWSGIDGAQGVTRAQYVEQYGSHFY